jgi:hypothetical protein
MLCCVTLMFRKSYELWRWCYVTNTICDSLCCVTLYVMWLLRFVTSMLCAATFSNSYVKWSLRYVMLRFFTAPWLHPLLTPPQTRTCQALGCYRSLAVTLIINPISALGQNTRNNYIQEVARTCCHFSKQLWGLNVCRHECMENRM